MFYFLSPPVLAALTFLIVIVLILDWRRPFLSQEAAIWLMVAMAMAAVAMGLLLLTVNAPLPEQALRVVLLLVGCAGVFALRRRRSGSNDERG